jgi:hypothetical protein
LIGGRRLCTSSLQNQQKKSSGELSAHALIIAKK